ncbi:MAG: DUF2059 domain-containing protein [Terriglobales bacterium]
MKLCHVVLVSLLACSLSAQSQSGSQSPAPVVKGQGVSKGPTSTALLGETKIDPAKEADIRRLLDLMKAGALVTQLMGGMEQNIRPLMTNSLPPGDYREKLLDLFFAKFHSKMQSSDLLDLVVPIYDKYYSREEIKGLIQFYETPLGQKMVSVTPQVTQESQVAGRQWGQQLGRDSMSEVLLEHPELEKALEDAKNPFPK